MLEQEQMARLQERLETRADADRKAWWEKYLRGVIPFRGVKMADIRDALHSWLADTTVPTRPGAPDSIGQQPVDAQRTLALKLMREELAEDKIAGILFLGEVLLPQGAIDWREDVPRFALLFQEEHIYDWNTCDWFCVKVLGPLVQQAGAPCAHAISGWRMAENLWQRRAAGVAFVNLAKSGDGNFPGFSRMLLETCATTVRDPERFAQTGTGWVLRELSLAEPDQVAGFVQDHLDLFSTEAFRSAISKLPKGTRDDLNQMRFDQQRAHGTEA
jgi:3-methyladenine DNA glycosylase AlkD